MADTGVKFVLTTQGVKEGAKDFQNFEKASTQAMSAAEASVVKSLTAIAAQYLSIGVTVNKAVKAMSSGVEFNKFVETQTMGFTVMMKSAEKAKAQMQELYDFAVNSPLTFKETASSAKQLMAYGFAAKELVPTMDRLGSVALATGHKLEDIAYVYGTLKSQGRVYSRDLMQFGMRGIPIYEELAKVMGVGTEKIQKMASEGVIGFKEVEQAFINMTTGSGKFAGIIDGYMETLTGKMSMLSDIMERSMGSLMEGATDALKDFVDNMATELSKASMQTFIEEASQSLGILASAISGVLQLVIKVLPLLTKFVTLWIAFGAVKLWFQLPTILAGMTASILNMGIATSALTASTVGLGTAWSEVGIAIGLTSAPILALLTPIALVATAIGGISSALKELQRKSKMMKDQDYFEQELVKQASGSRAGGMGISLDRFSTKDQISYVNSLAKQYGKEKAEVAQILYFNKLISAESATTLGFSVDNWVAQQKFAQQTERMAKELEGRGFISTLQAVGLNIQDWDTYVQEFQKSAEFLADPSKFKGVSMMVQPSLDWETTEIEKNLPSLDIVSGMIKAGVNQGVIDDTIKTTLTDRVGVLQGYLDAIIKRDALNPEDTNPRLIKWIADQLKSAEDQLGAIGKDNPVTKLLTPPKDLTKWWAPIEQATKNTISEMDDLTVAYDKQVESIQKEYQERLANYNLQLQFVDSADEYSHVMEMINTLTKTTLQYQKDTTKEFEKQKALKQFEYATQGNAAYFESLKAQSGASYASRATSSGVVSQGMVSMEGTEVGTLMAGGNPIAMAVSAFMDFAKEIENVNKVLNPFSTVIKSMSALLTPFINSALQPLVDLFEMAGEALSSFFIPVILQIKLWATKLYIYFLPLIAVIQVLAQAFNWFNDSVIVPIGNSLINIINGVLYAINNALGWLGVKLRYIDSLQTTVEALNDALNADILTATMEYAVEKLNSLIDGEISSLQDLYEVGAVTATEYEKQLTALNNQKVNLDQDLVDTAVKQLDTVKELSDWIQKNMVAYRLATATTSSVAGTTTEMPSTAAISVGELLMSAMDEFFSGLGNGLLTFIKSAFQGMVDFMKNPVTALQGLITDIGKVFTETIPGHFQNFFKFLGNVLDLSTAISAIKTVVDGISSSFSGISNTISNIKDYVDDLPGISNVVNGISGVVDTVKDWVYTVGHGLRLFAVGTPNVPNDMVAQIHKGEGIIPATFMEGIRSGELSLSGGNGNQGGGQNVYVTVNVAGSVQTENELSATIAANIYNQRRTGLLTV